MSSVLYETSTRVFWEWSVAVADPIKADVSSVGCMKLHSAICHLFWWKVFSPWWEGWELEATFRVAGRKPGLFISEITALYLSSRTRWRIIEFLKTFLLSGSCEGFTRRVSLFEVLTKMWTCGLMPQQVGNVICCPSETLGRMWGGVIFSYFLV